MLEKYNRGFSRGENCFHQVILIAEQIEAVAIAGMIDGPGFARGLLVSTQRQNHDVCFLRYLGGFPDAFSVERGSPSTTLSAFQSGSDSVILHPSA